MTPMPPRPGGVEIAAMVSSENIPVSGSGCWFLVHRNQKLETRNQKLISLVEL
jgi:hypothetical protein